MEILNVDHIDLCSRDGNSMGPKPRVFFFLIFFLATFDQHLTYYIPVVLHRK
jgi:hypothetical protein